MKIVRHVAVLAAVCTAVAIGASGAGAASPRQIYQDYLQHGKLTHHYSQADLQRALRSATLQGYTHGHTKGTKGAIKGNQGNGNNGGNSTGGGIAGGKAGGNRGGGLPFTGLDLSMMTVGAILLLAFGAGLRRFGRATS